VRYPGYREVAGGYLRTLGAELLAGRLVDERDVVGSRLAVVINETFAREYWPDQSPLGSRISFDYGGKSPTWRSVVGLVADIKERGLQLGMKPPCMFQ
jgi:putative ABC transport system permease protein